MHSLTCMCTCVYTCCVRLGDPTLLTVPPCYWIHLLVKMQLTRQESFASICTFGIFELFFKTTSLFSSRKWETLKSQEEKVGKFAYIYIILGTILEGAWMKLRWTWTTGSLFFETPCGLSCMLAVCLWFKRPKNLRLGLPVRAEASAFKY